MQNSLISVIVPAYRVEQYIEKCVASLTAQTYENLEILIACTPETAGQESRDDATLTLCRALAARDPRIHVLENTEFGVSNARNLALEQAKGDYIAFVDADDWVRKDYIESLYRTILDIRGEACPQDKTFAYGKTMTQMAICGFERAGAGRCTQELLYQSDQTIVIHMTRAQLLEQVLCNNTVGGYLWNKLFDADIIRRRRLRFQPELCIGEDMVFIAQYIKSVTVANYLNRVLYSYRTNAESALQKMYATGSVDPAKLESNLRAASIIGKLYQKECAEHTDIGRAVRYRRARTAMWAYFNLLKCGAYDGQMLLRIRNTMRGNWLSYCRSPYAKGMEKAVSAAVRFAPRFSFRMLNRIMRMVPKRVWKKYVKG